MSNRRKIRNFQPSHERQHPPQKPLVALCIPTHSGNVRGEIADLCARTGIWSIDPGHPFAYVLLRIAGKEPVDAARNFLVSEFLQTRAEWLQFIDADQAPPLEGMANLYRHPKEYSIVSGLTWMWRPDAPDGQELLLNQSRLSEDGKSFYPVIPPGWESGSCYEVDRVGTALMAIRRSLIERIGIPFPFLNQYAPDGSIERGEDVAFCDIARAAGAKILVDSSVVADHFKTVSLLRVARLVSRTSQNLMATAVARMKERIPCGHRVANIGPSGSCEICEPQTEEQIPEGFTLEQGV